MMFQFQPIHLLLLTLLFNFRPEIEESGEGSKSIYLFQEIDAICTDLSNSYTTIIE